MYSIFKCDIVNPGMKRDKYHSIAQRISFLFLILMIPVFLLFCLMLYIQFHYQNEASDELFVTRASNMAEMLEDEFDDINSACMDFLYDEELVRLASDLVYKTDYDLMKDYEAVIDTIASIGVNNDFIEEIQVYIPAKQRMLSDISGIHESDCSVSSFVNSDLIFIPLPGTCEDGLYSHAVAVKLDWDYINSYLNAISGGEIGFTLTGAEDMTDYGSESDGNHGYSVLVADGRYRLDISPAPETDNGILAAISICSLLAVILIAYFFILSLRYIIKPPLDRLMEGFNHLENGDYEIQLPDGRNDEFALIAGSFNHLVSKLEETDRYKSLLAKAEYERLQNWINPHFLYNGFFMISNLCRLDEVELASKLSSHLAKYYQYITRHSYSEDVLLSDEIEHLNEYIEIQKIRFTGKLDVSFPALTPDMGLIHLPPLLIEPIVENSFVHGLKKMECKKLMIDIRLSDDVLIVSIENNGVTSDEEFMKLNRLIDDKDESSAVGNVAKRLFLRYGTSGKITVSRREDSGLCTLICLPVETRGEDV